MKGDRGWSEESGAYNRMICISQCILQLYEGDTVERACLTQPLAIPSDFTAAGRRGQPATAGKADKPAKPAATAAKHALQVDTRNQVLRCPQLTQRHMDEAGQSAPSGSLFAW